MISIMEINNTDITTWALPENAIARLGRGRATSIAFSPDSTRLAVATHIGLWWYELAEMQPIALWETERGMLSAVAFSNDRQWIATGNSDGTVKVLDIQNQQCIVEIGPRKLNNGVAELTFSPDGQHLAASRFHYVGTVSVWDSETGMSVAEFTVEEPKAKSGMFRPLCFSPDGTLLAFMSGDNEISVSQIATGRQIIARFTVHSPRVDSLIFSPCGEFLAAGIRKRDNESRTVEVHIWNIPKETIETAIEYDGYQVRLAYTSEGSLRVADIHKDEVIIRDASHQKKLDTFEHLGDTRAARFSPDGALLASAGFDGAILLWDMKPYTKLG